MIAFCVEMFGYVDQEELCMEYRRLKVKKAFGILFHCIFNCKLKWMQWINGMLAGLKTKRFFGLKV